MTVQRAQTEAFEVLFSKKRPAKIFQNAMAWVLRRRNEDQPLFLLGVTKTPTSGKPIAVFGFHEPDTESAADRVLKTDVAYHCVVLEPGPAANRIIAREITLADGVFAYGSDSIEYQQY